jgi:hypothetical protein
MKLMTFSAALLLITLASCKPRKAIEFREAIVQKERVAFNILLDKNGSESRKLDCLVKEDYKGALTFVDQEEAAFDTLIQEIKTLPVDGIKEGNELKAAAVNYYVALKELHIFDRAEIVQREATQHSGGEELRAALDKIFTLNVQKQEMYKKVYEKERELHEALTKFNDVNSI